MPACQNCHNEWDRKQTLKALFTSNISQEGMKCPYCGESQFVSSSSRLKKVRFFPIVLGAIFVLMSIFTDYNFIPFLIFLGLIIVYTTITPSMVTLSNKRT